MKIHVVIGTRPQYIKWAAINFALRSSFSITLIDTGQHYSKELSGVFLQDFNLKSPNMNLHIGSKDRSAQVAQIIQRLGDYWARHRPDLVIVLGDTNSTLAGALAASMLNIPIGHVEAGIRSHNKQMPEEVNRILTDHMSSLLWCPTKTAVHNLRREALTEGVYQSGDVMYEVFLRNKKEFANKHIYREFNVSKGAYGVMTIHRQENTLNHVNIQKIIAGVALMQMPVIFSVHPRTRKIIHSFCLKIPSNLILVTPMGYIRFLSLVNDSSIVITDSGGLLREAAWLGVPCVVVRGETEWPELVRARWNKLVPPIPEAIAFATTEKRRTRDIEILFGNKKNSSRIVSSIKSWWRTQHGI